MNPTDTPFEPMIAPHDATPADALDVTDFDSFLRALRDDAPIRCGDVFGSFTVRRKLPSGGMGDIYLAEQSPLGRSTIFKVIRGQGTDAARTRFRNEWRVAGRLHHTSIVPVYAAGQEGDRDYYVMPYVRGASFREIIEAVRRQSNPGKLDVAKLIAGLADAKDSSFLRPWEKLGTMPNTFDGRPAADLDLPFRYYEWVAHRMIEVARAIAAAHAAGVLHLDVKPSNVLVETPSNLAKVIDLGLAHEFPLTETRVSIRCEPVGKEGTTAPEVLQGTADVRSDVYGLGLCLHELATLRKPPETGGTNAPKDLIEIARTALSRDPDDRYKSADEFADDIQHWLDGRTTVARSGLLQLPRAFYLWVCRNLPWAVTALVVLAVSVFSTLGAIAKQKAEAEQAIAREKQEADRQTEARKAAERERDQKAFETFVGKAREESLGTTKVGWSKRTFLNLESAKLLRPEADVSDVATSALAGLDAKLSYEYRTENAAGRLGYGDLAYDPKGERLVATAWWQSGKPSAAVVWDGNNANKPVETTRPGTGPVAFPDADSPLQLLLPLGKEKALTLWNVEKNAVVAEFPITYHCGVVSAALSRDGRLAAVSYVRFRGLPLILPMPIVDVATVIWSIDRKPAGVEVRKTAELPAIFSAIAFSPDGKVFAGGSILGQVTVYSTADGKELFSFIEGDLSVLALAFGKNYRRPSGRWPEVLGPAAGWLLAVGSKGGGLSVWNLRTKTRLNAFYGSEHDVFGVAFSRDGTKLASSGRYNPNVWDVGTGRPLLRIGKGGGQLWSWTEGVTFSPNSDRIAFGSTDPFAASGGIDVFRLEDDRGIRLYRGLTGVIAKTWLSPTGKYVAALSHNWQLGLWNRATGEAIYVWDVPAGWSADSAAVGFYKEDAELVFSSGKDATSWSLSSGERINSWELPRGLNDCLAVTPGGKPLLIRRDRRVWARELQANGKMIELFPISVSNPDTVTHIDLTLSSDGRLLLMNLQRPNQVGEIHLYNGHDGKEILIDRKQVSIPYNGAGLTDTGRVIRVNEVMKDAHRVHFYSLPDFKPLGSHGFGAGLCDDMAKLCLVLNNAGLELHRVGEHKHLMRLDAGPLPNTSTDRISTDGRFVVWGSRDGTVCVADVNKCMEQLGPFGKR